MMVFPKQTAQPVIRVLFSAMLAASLRVSAQDIAVRRVEGKGSANAHWSDTTGSRPLLDYTVKSFGPREGAPSQVMGVAQTPDGFLWLASTQGLFRFDGDRFVAQTQVTGGVSAVSTDKAGALWIGFQFGGIGRLKGGHYEDVGADYPRHTTWMIVPDDDGGIWTLTSTGIFCLANGQWRQVGASDGLPSDATPRHIGKLEDGSIWVAGPEGSNRAWLRRPHEARFSAIGAKELWWPLFGMHEKDVSGALAKTLDTVLGSILISFDRHPSGEIWHIVNHVGRLRWSTRDGKRTTLDDEFRLLDQVSGLTSVQHDREGNIWLGDTDGIIRVSPASLHAVAPRKELAAPVIARSPAGDVWIGANGGRGVYHATAEGLALWRNKEQSVVGIVADPGSLWIFHGGDVALKGAGAIEHVRVDGSEIPEPAPPRLERPVHVAIRDPRGGLLAATPAGYLRFAQGRWSQTPGVEGLPPSAPLRLAGGSAGQLWFGYPDGDIVRVDGTAVHRFPSGGTALGAIYAIAPGAGHTWVGGDAGVGVVLGDRVLTLSNNANGRFAGVRGVLETSSGELWINAARGVFQISRAGVKVLLRGETPKDSAVRLFDEDDGLQGGIVAINSAATLAEGGDGKIWMSRLDGANWFDPNGGLRNEVPAHAILESVSADGRLLRPSARLDVPPGTRTLEVGFTAPSLSRPERVTFQYRLSDVDPTWVDAGSRRFAAYSNVSPGSYKFEVRAFNEDGLGSPAPAGMDLVLAPTLMQTWWFRAACALALLGVLCALYAMRVRYLRERLRVRLEARHEERDRIARELHDTLLQTMHGLAMKVHAWSDGGDQGNAEQRKDMRRVAEAARLAVRESRSRIFELRIPPERSGLLEGILHAASQLAATGEKNFDVSETGRPRRVLTVACDDILAVAVEAMQNAERHSGSARIVVVVHHGVSALNLTVCDDGVGLPAHVLDAGKMTGHWGLVGMQERARRIGARLKVENKADGGARIYLVVPARRAYVRRHLTHLINLWG